MTFPVSFWSHKDGSTLAHRIKAYDTSRTEGVWENSSPRALLGRPRSTVVERVLGSRSSSHCHVTFGSHMTSLDLLPVVNKMLTSVLPPSWGFVGLSASKYGLSLSLGVVANCLRPLTPLCQHGKVWVQQQGTAGEIGAESYCRTDGSSFHTYSGHPAMYHRPGQPLPSDNRKQRLAKIKAFVRGAPGRGGKVGSHTQVITEK